VRDRGHPVFIADDTPEDFEVRGEREVSPSLAHVRQGYFWPGRGRM
jgi:hypothetical protein